MERDKSSLAERPSQLVVKESGRKPLFTSATSRGGEKNKENDRAQSNNSRFRSSVLSNGLSRSTSAQEERRGSSGSLASPRDSKIPRPGISSLNRQRLSIPDAFKLAAQESEDDTGDQTQAMDASPSPAPRSWRERREGDENRMRKVLGQDHLDTKAPTRPFSRESLASSTVPDAKPSPEKTESPRRRTYYGKSRIGLGPKQPAQEAPTPVGNEAKVEDRPQSAAGRLYPPGNWLRHIPSKDDLTNQGRIPALAPGIEDPLPSIEGGHNEPPNSQPAALASPEKSFAWQVDDDFTAGDLQVSDSPRIRMSNRPFANRIAFDDGSEIDINSRTRVAAPGSRNTKLDEIRSREVKTGSDIPVELPRSHNTKLDEIREREEMVEHQIPIPDRNAPRPRNTKLEEIRQREITGIPKRSLASIRLGEIREQNSMSRSLSPEENRPQTSRGIGPETKSSKEPETKEPPRPKSAFEIGGERIPDTPVTVYKSRRGSIEVPVKEDDEPKDEKDVLEGARPSLSHRRTDSRDLLRRLARATSSSPGPEPEPRRPADSDKPVPQPSEPKPDTASAIPQPATNNGPRYRQHRANRDSESKPTVGFVGLPRTLSTDSVKSKRSSTQSETDPTDRIEAEINLFAAAENQSEKGSVKAPSPAPESDDEKDLEATPRPHKPDPLSMPTPRVTGAYVETPATVKVEKIEIKEEKERLPKKEERAPRARSASLRNKRTERVTSGSDRDTASDPGTDEKSSSRSSSAGARRRRARSLTRRKGPLKNSARLPTVKDDLKELQRTHHIDDSTLDDLEEVLLGRKAPSRDLEALLDNLPEDPSLDDDFDFDLELDTKLNTRTNQIDPQSDNSDLVRLTRMNNTLKNSLYGIHTAARGIERLSEEVGTNHKSAENRAAENKIPKAEEVEDSTFELLKTEDELVEQKHPENNKPQATFEKMDVRNDDDGVRSACATHPGAGTMSYIEIPIPHLYYRKPSFRLSLLGLAVLLLSLWYAAESAMCAKFCRPTRCGKAPCIWSYDDPTFGNVIPVKLDQWTTGGRGRVLAAQFKEEADDWFADVVDVLRGREITDININGLSFEKKRQHRRRLRKKGYIKPIVETPEQKAKWDAWRRQKLAKERQREAREMGYHIEDDEEGTIGGDTRVG
ncbi:hypothetical protein FZEAL_4239 [Fusarium zealandicum]|uniref:Uncharacterized protein n=1 Tax=Fusarium zealandicum TaxID=1053134 RepID=A0A8H4UMQ1_9HYPO|nr:hypothetical protein FZEAL_4239 [Fusarium zealandicum]